MAKKGSKKIKFQPLADRVVVKRLEADEKTAGGIVLPDSAKEKPQRGTIVAVGEGRRLDSGELTPPPVEVGDRVIYSKYGGTEIEDGDEELLILGSSDIYAKKA